MIDRVNRVLLAVFGIVFVVGGVVMLVAAANVLALPMPGELSQRLQQSVGANPTLWWTLLLGATIVVLLLTATWSLRQLVVRREGEGLSTIIIDRSDRGRTTVEATKVAEVAAADLERSPLVTATSARLVHTSAGRQLRTRIDVLTNADLASVHHATGEVYARVAQLLGHDELRTQTRIRPVGGTPPRVGST